MITIQLDRIGKKFNREWIFRDLSCRIGAGEKLVILGSNGSGKSTLLQLLSGYVSPNEGSLSYQSEKGAIDAEKIKDHISFASPYLQLIEDLTATELLDHLRLFKPFLNDLPSSQILDLAQLSHTKNKFIRQYSSGMKQRLKLAIAILTEAPVLLLDEPLSNLDRNGTEWYKSMITKYTQERTVIVCSNAISDEYFFCSRELNVMDFKGQKK